jgi:predicted DNA-binding protein with PD1-like motif
MISKKDYGVVITMQKAKGKVSEIIVVRLQRGEDVTGRIKRACQDYGVKNAVILSMIGSFDGASYFDPIINPEKKCGISYGSPITLERPVQLLTAQGEICEDGQGEINVHLHATFADSRGNAYGGHISGLPNKVLNTVNVFIGVIEGVDMSYVYDDLLEGGVFYPKQL